jgi:acyl-CoA synthetase (AMP-forming)/AMP-acid ligase II
MMDLCRLLAEDRPADSIVARRWDAGIGSSQDVVWAQFVADVDRLHGRLADHQRGGWVLLTEDAYAFAVGLFALWHAESYAILPPTRQPEVLAQLQTRVVGVISDRPAWFESGSSIHPLDRDEDLADREPIRLSELGREAFAVELFTSGTTGDEKSTTKRIAHLEDEVAQLEAWRGAQLDGAWFFSTASHQHLYGLLFGVLWPLCSGRPFDAHHYLHADELLPKMLEAPTSVLASVPTSIKHIARHTSFPMLRERCRAVFSSGGPLPTTTAHAVADVLGSAPVEVLGSTETGGIAWREQSPAVDDVPWTPFACVQIRRDEETGILRVDSPLVSIASGDSGFATGDLIELCPDGRFRLGGRSNQVAKVGEKRVDLAYMGSQLRSHEWIDDAALTTIERDTEQRVAAVLVASRRGLEVLRLQGRRAFIREVRASLSDRWDPVVHPRHWRFVDRLPDNEQGKLTRDALTALFRDAVLPTRTTDRPRIHEEVRSSGSIERTCEVPEDLQCFNGHFPGFPVVPGILQLDWAMELVAVLLGSSPAIQEIESFKLIRPLGPGMQFRLQVAIDDTDEMDEAEPDCLAMKFSLSSEKETFSVGRITLVASGSSSA